MGERYSQTTPFALKYRLQQLRRPYNRTEVRRLPFDLIGVYAIWLPMDIEGTPECLYVGKSETCVRRRLLQHLQNETNPELRRELRLFRDVLEFSVALTANVEETDALETQVIKDWQPQTNRNKL